MDRNVNTDAHLTERSAVARTMVLMWEIIKNKGLDIGLPDVETGGKDRKFPDLIMYESKYRNKILCVIEAKPPEWDVFNPILIDDARKKAIQRKAKYFATTNFRDLIWFDTSKSAVELEEEQTINRYHLSDMESLSDFDRYQKGIREGLERFLIELYEVYKGKKAIPRLPLDELLIFRLQEKIKTLTRLYTPLIEDKAKENRQFRRQLKEWFVEQGWDFSGQGQDYQKAARQAAYLLVDKILFYNALKPILKLDRLEVPKSLTDSRILQKVLQAYFEKVLDIDYETIFTTDFIDELAFLESKEVVEEIRQLVDALNRYDISKIGYDIIGRIFERLIPLRERHQLGQYFTSSDVVDIILRFCMKHEDDKILDPACGAGTFLVRAYTHKKIMNQMKSHESILETLWGVDIAKFPAHLSTINLAVRDLSSQKNYPNIIHSDFFELKATKEGFNADSWRRKRAMTLGVEPRKVTYPKFFDAVVGNPPYTRQEEIEDTGIDKNKLIKAALYDGAKKIANINERAGIYVYFFAHGTKFLREGGYFGFVVSNSWLDVDYGKGLQEFLLKNYKIVAIISSKVERWFEDADVNTCIVILQKAKKKEERDNNLVRFVYLKKPLKEIVTPAQGSWEMQEKRLADIDKLIRTILHHKELYENDTLRVYPKKQKELWNEGFNSEKGKYEGAKWGKYLRAPDIFFTVLKKGKDKLVKLGDIAEVRFGIKTGANEFFYLPKPGETNKFFRAEMDKNTGNLVLMSKKSGGMMFRIEKEYWMHEVEGDNEELKKIYEFIYVDSNRSVWIPNYVVKSLKDVKNIVVKPKDLKNIVLMVHEDKEQLKGKNVLKYIKWGESQGYKDRKTCSSRKIWYDLGTEVKDESGFSERFRKRFFVILNHSQCYLNKNLYGIHLRNDDSETLCSILNSSLSILFIELNGRQPGGGGPLDLDVWMVKTIPIVDLRAISHSQKERLKASLKALSSRVIKTVFEEIGANSPNEVSLEKVKPDRRELDKIVMGEILGLTEEEQLEVYRAVIDLVKSRIEKAKSGNRKRKVKEGIDIEASVRNILEEVKTYNPFALYSEIEALPDKEKRLVTIPDNTTKITKKTELGGVRLHIDRKKVIDCKDETEADYIMLLFKMGVYKIAIPEDSNKLQEVVEKLKEKYDRVVEILEEHLEGISNNKITTQIKHRVWRELQKGLNTDLQDRGEQETKK